MKAFLVGAPWREKIMTATSPKKILIVSGAATFNGHGGSLNTHYSEFAAEVLCGLGHSVEVTTVDRDFDPSEEARRSWRPTR